MSLVRRGSIPVTQQSLRKNSLLAVLPSESCPILLPHLLPINLERGDILYDCLSRSQYVYFPTTSMISLMYELEDGFSAEVAVIGREGVVGVSLLMGENRSLCHAVVQIAGGAFRIRTDVLQREFDKSGGLQHLLLLSIQALIAQISQTVVCNRHHTIEQQFCRWLLLSLDRAPSNNLSMTHELIANNLGVRRESVTGAALKLQAEKLIQSRRGLISVLDRPRLEARACECYAVVKRECDRLALANAVMVNKPRDRRSQDSVGPKVRATI